jgi:hypothetical protein
MRGMRFESTSIAYPSWLLMGCIQKAVTRGCRNERSKFFLGQLRLPTIGPHWLKQKNGKIGESLAREVELVRARGSGSAGSILTGAGHQRVPLQFGHLVSSGARRRRSGGRVWSGGRKRGAFAMEPWELAD